MQIIQKNETIRVNSREADTPELISRSDVLSEQQYVDLGLQELAEELQRRKSTSFNFLDFRRKVIQNRGIMATRLQWAESLALPALLAKYIPPGTPTDGLSEFKKLAVEGKYVEKILEAFYNDAKRVLKDAVENLRRIEYSATEIMSNSKFSGFDEAEFGTLDDYHAGIEKQLKPGQPNPNLERGIQAELTEHGSCQRFFVTPNYQITTCLLIEYWFAKDPNHAPEEVMRLLNLLNSGRSVEGMKQNEVAGAFDEATRTSDVMNLREDKIHNGYSWREHGILDELYPGEKGNRRWETRVAFLIHKSGTVETRSEIEQKNQFARIFSSAKSLIVSDDTAKAPTQSKEADIMQKFRQADLKQKFIKHGALKSMEEQVRSIELFSLKDFRRLENHRKHIMQPFAEQEKTLSESNTCESTFVGIVLPMSKATTLARIQSVRDAIVEVVGRDCMVEQINPVMEKEIVYCDATSLHSLRKNVNIKSDQQNKEWIQKQNDSSEHSLENVCEIAIDKMKESIKKDFSNTLKKAAEDGLDLNTISRQWRDHLVRPLQLARQVGIWNVKELLKIYNEKKSHVLHSVQNVVLLHNDEKSDELESEMILKEHQDEEALKLRQDVQELSVFEYESTIECLQNEEEFKKLDVEAKVQKLQDALISDQHYEDVEKWINGWLERKQGRSRIGLNNLMKNKEIEIARFGVCPSEVLALYLYTGPLFVPMNSVLRRSPSNILDLLRDNQSDQNMLCTTIFCMVSALKKLSMRMEIPEDCKVYRGLGRKCLPRTFLTANGSPAWRGAVERAFMSTTTDKNVAIEYTKSGGTVLEISVGRVQIGGDMSWISMVRLHSSHLYEFNLNKLLAVLIRRLLSAYFKTDDPNVILA
jgi:hypothetical protein